MLGPQKIFVVLGFNTVWRVVFCTLCQHTRILNEFLPIRKYRKIVTVIEFANSDFMFVEYMLTETNTVNWGLEFQLRYCHVSDWCHTVFPCYIYQSEGIFISQVCHEAYCFFWFICKDVKSQVWRPIFELIIDSFTLSLFLSTQSTNHWIVLSALLTTLCPMLVLLLPK